MFGSKKAKLSPETVNFLMRAVAQRTSVLVDKLIKDLPEKDKADLGKYPALVLGDRVENAVHQAYNDVVAQISASL